MCVVKQDGLDHAWEDLGHVVAHDLRDHLGEVDARLQWLGPDEQVVGELMEFAYHLREVERGGVGRESANSVINNQQQQKSVAL